MTDKLTVTAGLRWDAQWNPQPSDPNPAIPSTTYIPSDLSQWQPRLGVAWAPDSKTVLRASAGLYDAPTPATYFQRVFTDNGLNTTVADSYLRSTVTLNLFVMPSLLPTRLYRGGEDSATPAALVVGIAPKLPQSAFVPGLRQRGAANQCQDHSNRRLMSTTARGTCRRWSTRICSRPLGGHGHADLSRNASRSHRLGSCLVNRSSAHSRPTMECS